MPTGRRLPGLRAGGDADEGDAPFCMAVLHPAYVLRQEGEAFTAARRLLVKDIAEAKRKVEEIGARRRAEGRPLPRDSSIPG